MLEEAGHLKINILAVTRNDCDTSHGNTLFFVQLDTLSPLIYVDCTVMFSLVLVEPTGFEPRCSEQRCSIASGTASIPMASIPSTILTGSLPCTWVHPSFHGLRKQVFLCSPPFLLWIGLGCVRWGSGGLPTSLDSPFANDKVGHDAFLVAAVGKGRRAGAATRRREHRGAAGVAGAPAADAGGVGPTTGGSRVLCKGQERPCKR